MVAKAGSHLLAATAFAVLVGAGVGADSARAQAGACLASPNGPAPAGTHWYYKTDQATRQKCWYTRPQDQAAAAAPAQMAPRQAAPLRPAAERGDAASPDGDAASAPEQSAAPIALAPAAAPPVPARVVRTVPAAPRRIAAPIARIPMPAADPRGERQPIDTAAAAAPTPAAVQADPDNVSWPDPPPLPQTVGAAGSPFPPPPNVGSQADASGPSSAMQQPGADAPSPAAGVVPSATAPPATAEKPDAAAGKADTDKSSAAKPPGRVSVLLVLGGLILLLAAGMLLRGLVEHGLSRRRIIKLARQEPRLMEPVAVPPPMPTLRQAPSVVPGHVQAAQRAGEVEAELRKFAESLRQRRPAANGTANGAMGRSGAVLRS